jgi:glycosyltransferase involved in cell wall biosynthesis
MVKTSTNSKVAVSVIVPVFNAQETLQRCLSALAVSATESTEIILVDNNSTDNSLLICEEFRQTHDRIRILLLQESVKGPSAARNAGAGRARGAWLIFTDADCVPSPSWISDYLAHFSGDRLGAIAGSIRPYPPSNVVQKATSLFTLPPITKGTIHTGSNLTAGFYSTANLAVKKEVFNLIRGFNERLTIGEDHELCYNIYGAGYRIKTIETAVVDHIHRSTLKGLLRQAFRFGSFHPFELRHFTPGKTILDSPLVHINMPTPGKWIWIDLNQADKKLLISLIPGLFWPPLYFLSIMYIFYLGFFIRRIGADRNVIIKVKELPALSLLLLLKSFVLGFGRFLYGLKHRVLCI